MDWFLRPESFVDKILVMIVAVLLFVVVLSAILWLVDREKTPKWLVAVGFIGPVTLALIIGLLYPALKTVYRSFQVSSVVRGENGKPIIDRQTGQRQTELTFSFDNYGTVIFTSELPAGADQHRPLGRPGADHRHRLRARLRGPGRPHPIREGRPRR